MPNGKAVRQSGTSRLIALQDGQQKNIRERRNKLEKNVGTGKGGSEYERRVVTQVGRLGNRKLGRKYMMRRGRQGGRKEVKNEKRWLKES